MEYYIKRKKWNYGWSGYKKEYEKGLNIFSNKINLEENIYNIFKKISAKTDRRPSYATVNEMFKNFEDGKKLVEIINSEEMKFGNYQKL